MFEKGFTDQSIMSSSRKAAEEISFRTVQHGSELYQGKYGTIKKCLSAYGKPMTYEKIPSTSSKEIEKQCNLMIDFSHINLLRSYKCERSDNATIIIYSELVGGGTLKSVVENFGNVSEPIAGGYVGQILRGLQYLHGQAYYLGGFQLTDVIVAAQGVLKIINVYSLPIHNGSFATDNERRLADLNSVGRFVEELCSAKSLSDQAKDFIRCCEAQTSAGQLLTHPFCLVDKFLNWEKAGSGSVNMFTQRTGRFAGPSARRGRGRGTARRGATARRGKAPNFAISARLSGRAPPTLNPSIGVSSGRRGGIGSSRRGGPIVSGRRGGMSSRNNATGANTGLAKPPTPSHNNGHIVHSSARRGGIGSGRRGMPIGSGRRGMPIGSGRRGMPIGSGRRGMPIGSGRRGMPIGSGRRGMPIGSGRRGMPIGSGRTGFKPPTPHGNPPAQQNKFSARRGGGGGMSGRVGFKPPTPSGPPPNGNSISTGRSMLSGRVGFKPPTPSGEPPQSAKIMSGRRGAMSTWCNVWSTWCNVWSTRWNVW